jgi:hypothetical protein
MTTDNKSQTRFMSIPPQEKDFGNSSRSAKNTASVSG